MLSVDDLQAKFESEMSLSASQPQTYAEGSTQNQPNTNSIANSAATNNNVPSFANEYKMNIADQLVPVEDDGTRRQSNLR